VVDPHRMMRLTYAVRPKGLLDHSYMHGACGSISAQYAVVAYFLVDEGQGKEWACRPQTLFGGAGSAG
jgi:hypothetical protein